MLLRRYVFLVEPPVICVRMLCLQVRQLTHQLLARGIIADAAAIHPYTNPSLYYRTLRLMSRSALDICI